MADIRTELGGTGPDGTGLVRVTFAVRAVILSQRGPEVLVEGGPFPFYNLPGGAMRLGERLRDAAAREWHEETGLQVGELRPVGLIENFFELDGRRWHELGLYYALPAPEELAGRVQNADNRANHLTWVNPAEADRPICPVPALTLANVPEGQFRHIINHGGTPAPGRDLRFQHQGHRVQVRVHLLYVQGGELLTNTVPGSDFWFLPGGTVALNEDSHAAALREFREETGVEAVSARLVGISEGFDRTAPGQQLGLCYRVEAARSLPPRPYPVQDHAELELQWVPLDEVDRLPVHPAGLGRMLAAGPGEVVHDAWEARPGA